jgi:hypothetical protein
MAVPVPVQSIRRALEPQRQHPQWGTVHQTDLDLVPPRVLAY